MKIVRTLMVVFLLPTFVGCHSAVQIDSVPAGAKVYKDAGDPVCLSRNTH
jgi:hypothetical protein